MGRSLSKSKFCMGIQCPKMLWLAENKPEFAEKVTNDSDLENGKLVGEIARGYFGDYSLVHYNADHSIMVEDTASLMQGGCECIAEASFLYDGLFCSVDLLHKSDSGFDLIEVKSSTSVSDIYLEDVSYQYYVLVNSGIPINHAYIMYINNQYVRQGEIDLQSLFVMADYTEEAKSRQDSVQSKIQELREYLLYENEPERDLDLYCETPYKCAFKNFCRRSILGQSVFDICGLRKIVQYKLYHQGIITFEDIIKRNIKLSKTQLDQVEVSYYHKPDVIDKAKIKDFLDGLSYPIYYLDFETYQTVIPEFDGLHPYDKIPFQYSLHIEYEDGRLDHKEFLAEAGTDPRRKLAEQLVNDIPDNVCVLAFNMGFEKGMINQLAEIYEDLADHLLNIHGNIKDLMIPFKKHYYYTEAMQGSYSIKYVLPALYPDDPGMNYHNLEGIHDGGEASAAFPNMKNMSPEEVEKTRENLLKYCGLDTFAMVKVVEKLRDLVSV